MFEHKKITGLDDFFMELGDRQGKCVYFYRVNGYNVEVGSFIRRYYEAARRSGVVIEGKIPNPDEKNLSYYEEIMGMDFRLSLGFITSSLKKWLPRMDDYQRNAVAASIYDTLEALRRAGKNENMLRNAYIKFMCWLYYKFERIVGQLGGNKVPKILYEGEISSYELMLISVLSGAGCDVVLLQYKGDGSYRKVDPGLALSEELALPGMGPFPEGFNLKWLRGEIQKELDNERLYGKKPEAAACTNAWITGNVLEDIKSRADSRGDGQKFFYNCYCRVSGVEDKLTYLNELYQFQLELKSAKRKAVVIDEVIPPPTMEEIGSVSRKTYAGREQMILDLSGNIRYTANIELQRLMVKAFVDVLLEESGLPGMNVNKLTNKAVYLICWLKRYQPMLFTNWRMPDISCFIYMGGCRNENEAMFVRLLARLPVDVLVLVPDLNVKCCLEDRILYEKHYEDTLAVKKFPQENSDVHIGTAAYHAERELDTLIYQDSGIYRNQQYTRANTVTLQTIYEEIALLWKEDVKYRPNFSTVEGVVNIPVIFAKASGVKDGLVPQYWAGIKELMTEDTFLIKKVPFIGPTDPNPIKAYAAELYKNGKVLRNKIKSHPKYQYGFLREEVQEHILDKLQLLIGQKLIKGTFENGTEYAILSTVLNLPKDILRMIQKFDFTMKNPKLIYINTGEEMISLEDSILTAFLNLVGFDVVFFVPTGYQNVEKYFNRQPMEEHQIGEYVYDLQVPDLGRVPADTRTRPSWRDKLFKRGT